MKLVLSVCDDILHGKRSGPDGSIYAIRIGIGWSKKIEVNSIISSEIESFATKNNSLSFNESKKIEISSINSSEIESAAKYNFRSFIRK